ncbi:hypothetical protein JN06_00499 [Bacteroides zoogleoformans]|uniref:Uncharacterized protein n=1 Tax=Bacteroides zoogleoformans TaxID=28119 RepID=A0ABM6T974_9BACE|nr:hypothetical protein [Bacteroides zoogleoformans]AVM53150.1 hypothetical protein C4H11_09590 [Bacteroides zoogleoformans]TWJ17924.1 hypothetical protein JN06_00499 [Bacteroides zoogleoformans]
MLLPNGLTPADFDTYSSFSSKKKISFTGFPNVRDIFSANSVEGMLFLKEIDKTGVFPPKKIIIYKLCYVEKEPRH